MKTRLERDILIRASEAFRDLAHGVDQGRVSISDTREFQQVILDLARRAQRTIDAVDRIKLDGWWVTPAMQVFLSMQGQLVDSGIQITRVRVVEDDLLEEPTYRENLKRYASLQKQAGVRLHILLSSKLAALDSSADQRAWLLMDRHDPGRATGAYGLLVQGVVREGTIFLRPTAEMRRLSDEFDKWLQAAIETGPSVTSRLEP